MVTDIIADMLTRIRNASSVKHNFTLISFSKLNLAILNIFQKEGYIQFYSIEESKSDFFVIKVTLKYKGWWIKKSFFSIIKRISKPGKRIYLSYRKLDQVINTFKNEPGVAVISTSLGIMSHYKAIQLKQGGEVLCFIG